MLTRLFGPYADAPPWPACCRAALASLTRHHWTFVQCQHDVCIMSERFLYYVGMTFVLCQDCCIMSERLLYDVTPIVVIYIYISHCDIISERLSYYVGTMFLLCLNCFCNMSTRLLYYVGTAFLLCRNFLYYVGKTIVLCRDDLSIMSERFY